LSPSPAYLVDFFEYVRWADLAQLQATATLSDELYVKDHGWSFGTVHNVMLHMLSAQSIWRQRFEDETPVWLYALPEMQPRTAIGPAWAGIHDRVASFLARQTDASLTRTIAFKNMRGESYSGPLWRFVTHMLNHSTIHRGQLNSMLKLCNHAAPAVDYSTWFYGLPR
jgi:uncharacterized damage-inducible protein DinB